MGRPRKTIEAIGDAAPEIGYVDDATNRQVIELPEDDEPESGLDRVLAMIRGGSLDRTKVKLYRRNADGIEAWCVDWTAEEFEAAGYETIRRRWGAGAYTLMVYGPNPRAGGKWTRLAREVFSIESDALANPATMGGAPTGLEAAMRSMAETQARMLEALTARRNEPAPDPMAQLAAMMALASQMREAFGINASPAVQQKSSIGEIVEAIKELRGASEVLGGGGEQSDLSKLLDTAGPIVEIVKAQLSQRATPAMPDAPLPTLALPPSVANATPPVEQAAALTLSRLLDNRTPEQQEKLMTELMQALNELLAMASAGKSPEQGSDFLADRLPDELFDFLDRPGWFELLAGVAPQVKPHEAWLREAVRLLDEDPGEDSTQESPAPGVAQTRAA